MKSDSSFLFVYGTLRSECTNPHSEYLRNHSELLGKASIPGLLIDMGSYPGLIHIEKEDSRVIGELYKLSDENFNSIVRYLDMYEGCSQPAHTEDEYIRKICKVFIGDESHMAQTYILQHEYDVKRIIPGGDYIKYLKDRGVQSLHDPSRKTKTNIKKGNGG